MNREQAWQHACHIVNDRGETVDPCAPSNAALDLARLVVYVTPCYSEHFGTWLSLVSTIVVIHRDPGLRLGDDEAKQLAQADYARRGHKPVEPSFIL